MRSFLTREQGCADAQANGGRFDWHDAAEHLPEDVIRAHGLPAVAVVDVADVAEAPYVEINDSYTFRTTAVA